MKDNLTDQNNELFKNMLSKIDDLPEYDLGLETKIMGKIGLESGHEILLNKYRKWQRLGFRFSIILVIVLIGISFWSMSKTINVSPDDLGIQHFIPSFFTIIGFVLIFAQLELKKIADI